MSLLLAVVFLGVLVLILEILQLRKAIVPVAVSVLLLLFGGTVYELYTGITVWDISGFSDMIAFNKFAHGFSALFLLLTAFILCIIPFSTRERPTQRSD